LNLGDTIKIETYHSREGKKMTAGLLESDEV